MLKMSIRFLGWLGLGLLFGTGVTAPQAAGSSPVFANAQSVAVATPIPKGQQAGRQIFAANCAACHGINGGGSIGPSLQQIAARKSLDQTVGFIENPVGRMPKLYPGELSAEQVREVSTYIRAAFQSPGSVNAQPNGGPGGRMGPGMMNGNGRGGNGGGHQNAPATPGPGMMNGNGRH